MRNTTWSQWYTESKKINSIGGETESEVTRDWEKWSGCSEEEGLPNATSGK
jgi:hypothetical protein